jgi:adenylyltransferase/sulfurtransferase
LYPEPPPPGLVPNCAEAGVLGVLPGIIGTIQANEALKLILGIGNSLVGRLLLFDALAMQFREMKLHKNPDCPMCGAHPTITRLIDYEEFCGVKSPLSTQQITNDTEISVEQLKQRLDNGDNVFLLDVREPYEYKLVNLGGDLIPLRAIPTRIAELDASKEIVVYCHHGTRSAHAVNFLQKAGFTNVKNLVGGIDQWSLKIDPKLPRY